MKPSQKLDRICIQKIVNYIGEIKLCFEHFHVDTHEDFENARLSQLATTQLITNIYELKKKIRSESLNRMPEFNKLKLSVARNVASHEYENIDTEMIYHICEKLLSKGINDELIEVITDDADDE
jgi:uncharacterized protein with HEPN domain